LFRKRSTETSPRDVTVAKVYKLSETPATQLAGISVLDKAPEGTDVFRLPQPQGKAPWDLRNKAELELLQLLRSASDETIDDVLVLRQGLKTGADNIFVIEESPLDSELYVLHSKQEVFRLEKELLIRVLRNRDLLRWGARARSFVIYPYDRKKEKLLAWNDLKKHWPGVAAYLEANREDLSKRKSLRRKHWYELIEPRLATINSDEPKLVAGEIGIRPIICKTDPPNAAIVGNAWLMLKNQSYDLEATLAYLNSAVTEWHLRQVSPLLQGGYILLRQTNLSKLPLPRFLKDSSTFIHQELKRLSSQLTKMLVESQTPNHPTLQVEVRKTEDQIDSLIMEALNFGPVHAQQLRKLNSLTRRSLSRAKN
jgi:hypothetical protein